MSGIFDSTPESPCLKCKYRKMSKNKCIDFESCPLNDSLNRGERKKKEKEGKREGKRKDMIECPVEGCYNLMCKTSFCCSDHQNTICYRKRVGVPPDIIFSKTIDKNWRETHGVYKWK